MKEQFMAINTDPDMWQKTKLESYKCIEIEITQTNNEKRSWSKNQTKDDIDKRLCCVVELFVYDNINM